MGWNVEGDAFKSTLENVSHFIDGNSEGAKYKHAPYFFFKLQNFKFIDLIYLSLI